MRFIKKRPKLKDVEEEVSSLLDIMVSNTFIIIDLLVYSFIFTLLISSQLNSIFISILFFFGCFSLFYCIYFFIIDKLLKKKLNF